MRIFWKQPIQPHFYPRSPCGERPANPLPITSPTTFLSTLSLRRATRGWTLNINGPMNFYPRSPCGERLILIALSIQRTIFLSTLSLRRATMCPIICTMPLSISIHALLAESDINTYHRIFGDGEYFYPRSPCGERLFVFCEGVSLLRISIHALLAESDGGGLLSCFIRTIFLSTLSLRRATMGRNEKSFRG